MTTMTITIEPMTDIRTACHLACDLAKKEGCNVRFDFNGKRMLASPGTIPNLMANAYYQPENETPLGNSGHTLIADLLPPKEIVEAADKVCQWMKANGYTNWQLGGLCSRNHAVKLAALSSKASPLDGV